MEIINNDKYQYLVDSISTNIKGKCQVHTYRDEKGIKRYFCTDFTHDKNETQYHLLGVGYKDTAYTSCTKDGKILCYNKDNQYLGNSTTLEYQLKWAKENLSQIINN